MNSNVFNGGSMAAWITAKEKLIMKFKGENVHHIILNEIPDILLDNDEENIILTTKHYEDSDKTIIMDSGSTTHVLGDLKFLIF